MDGVRQYYLSKLFFGIQQTFFSGSSRLAEQVILHRRTSVLQGDFFDWSYEEKIEYGNKLEYGTGHLIKLSECRS